MNIKRWRSVERPPGLSFDDLQNVISACGNSVALRVSHDSGFAQLELLCADEGEFVRGEVLVHQAIADQHLRRIIDARSDSEISKLVDGLILRAIKG